MMTDTDLEDPSEWISYDDFAEERINQLEKMLEQFDIPGPGPPDIHGLGFSLDILFEDVNIEEASTFFAPPPPIPGTRKQCVDFSLHFASCDIPKVPTSEDTPHQHLISVIVLVCCVITIVTCIVVFLVWRRRRSKSHLRHLQLGTSSRRRNSEEFYDGFLQTFPHTTRPNNYLVDKTLHRNNQSINLNTFLLHPKQSSQENFSHPIYEEIYDRGDFLDNYSGLEYRCVKQPTGHQTIGCYDDLNEKGPFLIQQDMSQMCEVQTTRKPTNTNKQFFTFWRDRDPMAIVKSDKNNHCMEVSSEKISAPSSDEISEFKPRDAWLSVRRPPDGKKQSYPKTLEYPAKRKQGSEHGARTVETKRKHRLPLNTSCSQNLLKSVSRISEPKLMPNPDNILPQCAWTDDWPNIDNDNNPVEEDHMGIPDVVSSLPYSPSVCSPSDVTMSATSSEEYPECTWKHSSQSSSEHTSR